MKDKDKIKELTPFEELKYENIDLDHLIMYAIDQIEKKGVDLSYENIVVAAFKLFPNKFSLPGFKEYPDSNRVEQCLWRCTYKTKQWLGGKTKHGFFITERSRKFIKETENLLKGIVSKKKTKATSQTRRKEYLLEEVISSPAYLKYKRGQGNTITETEFCFLLQGTLDSLKESLKENFISLKNFAEELKREDVLKFLNWLENNFNKYLNSNEK